VEDEHMSIERAEAVQAYNIAMIAFVAAQAAFMENVFAGTAGAPSALTGARGGL
jgi:hypothetical protein